jgi:olefin beta-lactone synthetase
VVTTASDPHRRPSTPTAGAAGWLPDRPSDADWRRWDLDPSWSRLVDVPSHEGGTHRWHLLDTGVPAGADPATTPIVLCVHGNPTWGYAWATFLRRLHGRARVIAVDQLGMGYSERTRRRRYVDRVRDLDDVIVALGLTGGAPLVIAAHDWGGAIALGWVVQDPQQVAGMVLCNTGIAVPEGRSAPAIIRLAAWAPLLDLVCRGTPTFVEGTVRLSRRRISGADRHAFRAPYRTATARAAIADFVDDIPLQPGHPSERPIADVASRLGGVSAPVLLAWGARDPVFDDDFAADLQSRLPSTTLQRFERANHLVMAEADVAGAVDAWLTDLLDGRLTADAGDDAPVAAGPDATPPGALAPVWSAVAARRDDRTDAFVDMASGDAVSFSTLARRIDGIAAELARRGLQPGDHVAMLTPPGVDLVAAVYGVWRAGGVTVIADRGLGLRSLGRAVRSTRPAWVIGPRQALAAAAVMRWTPRAERIDVGALIAAADATIHPPPREPAPGDPVAVLFTSGATGPPKGVRYRHRQLAAQRDALARTYAITADDRLVAAFAPFSLYGPALGITTALPACDVTKPAELTAATLDAACARIGATLAFASPSALANVVATSGGAGRAGLGGLRLVMSAGAPVPSETLAAIGRLATGAEMHTPYGMTEVLPVADIGLTDIQRAETDHPYGGVCVGRPVDGVEVRIVPLGFDPETLPTGLAVGEMGEILVRAPWVSDGYHGLWAVQRAARPGDGAWHRSGDVGHLDGDGRLWVEGRSVHVVHAPSGPITPVPIERAVERALELQRVAAVGVGPIGSQQLVLVLELPELPSDGAAPAELAASARHVVERPVASVLGAGALPVDIRHNAKIDRTAVAAWATELLAGRRPRSLT